MPSLLAKIWRTVKKFLQQFLSSLDNPTTSDRKEAPKPYRPLSDEDYEYLWMQLLEGVANGWQPGRIQRFFETLGDRGHRDAWLAWLERYEAKLLASPSQDSVLARRLVKLGEHTQALPEQSSARRVGQTAARLGKVLLTPRTQPQQEIWEYDGPDAVTLNSEPVTPVSEREVPEEYVVEAEEKAVSEAAPALPPPPGAENDQQTLPEAEIPQLVVENAPDPEAWFNRGVQFYEAEDYEQAIRYWDKAIALKSDYYQAWSNRGLALKNLGAWTEALENYEKALEINSSYTKAWYNRGIALDVLRRYDDAITSFDRVLAQDGDDFRAWFHRGNTLQQCQRYEEAIASYDEALNRQGELERAWYERGNAFLHLNNPENAIASYDKAIALTAEDSEIWYSRGQALVIADKKEEAIASYDRALQLKPDAWHIWIGRSIAVKKSQNPDLLLTSLSPVAQKHPELNQRGETGEIASLEVGLHYLLPETHPEGWGRLHWRIGQIQYHQGWQNSQPFALWREATSRYQEALKAVIPATFPVLYLAILQDLVEVQIGLEESSLATQLHQRGLQQFHNFLVDPQRPETQKEQLQQQLTRFEDLSVPIQIQAGSLTDALETSSAAGMWTQLQNHLDPTTAVVYWHQSPAALTTFIILPDTAEPIVLHRPANVVAKVVLTPLVRAKIRACQGDSQQLNSYLLELLNLKGDRDTPLLSPPVDRCPPDLQRLHRFQEWQQAWQHLGVSSTEWRRKLPELLHQLGNILDITAILGELNEYSQKIPYLSLQNLILVPPPEMGQLPLAALFHLGLTPHADLDITISTLPHLQAVTWGENQAFNPQKALYLTDTDESELFQALKTPLDPIQQQIIENADAGMAALGTDNNIIYLENVQINSQGIAVGDRLLGTWQQLENFSFSGTPAIALDLAQIDDTATRLIALWLRQGAVCILYPHWRVESIARTLLLLEFYRQLSASNSPQNALKQAQTWLQTATYRELQQWCQAQDNDALDNYIQELANTPDKLESSQPPYANPYYWAGWQISSRLLSDPK
ncbi:MAG: tetratricopeptide repeat protein [Jaaginema sp. PMC 1079.18]|nr:tetratricopeptide repeat protein [Jaaginema sp. PMC 1080.18]MEC4849424.1 tetratricopeptide repeat protein [Jaaginema sp. PMC 1079.18]MEC4864944.1 tetratricopeptide repeat protein [Jaaginema sp. PMC 1078.18]